MGEPAECFAVLQVPKFKLMFLEHTFLCPDEGRRLVVPPCCFNEAKNAKD